MPPKKQSSIAAEQIGNVTGRAKRPIKVKKFDDELGEDDDSDDYVAKPASRARKPTKKKATVNVESFDDEDDDYIPASKTKQKKINSAKKPSKKKEEESEEEELDEELEDEDENDESETNGSKYTNPNKILLIKNLPLKTTEKDIRSLDINIIKVNFTDAKNDSKSKYALCEYRNVSLAQKAIDQLQNKEVNGAKIIVDFIGSQGKIASSACSSIHDPCKLYITGFGQKITRTNLEEMFPSADRITLDLNPKDQKPLGFAYIHFKEADEAKRVHDQMQDVKFEGRTLVVMYGKKTSPDDILNNNKTANGNKRKTDGNDNAMNKKIKIDSHTESAEEEEVSEEEEDDEHLEDEDGEEEDVEDELGESGESEEEEKEGESGEEEESCEGEDAENE